MAYIAYTYLYGSGLITQENLANLVDKTNDPGQLDAPALAIIAEAIAAVDSVVDSHISVVYSGALPLTSPPNSVKRCVAIGTLYQLWQGQQVPHESNPYADAWEDQIMWLKAIANGSANLDLTDDGGGIIGPQPPKYNTDRQYTDRQFSPDSTDILEF